MDGGAATARRERIDPNQLALFDSSVEEATAPIEPTAVQAHARRGGGRNWPAGLAGLQPAIRRLQGAMTRLATAS
jgi:hypothetical protein